MRILLTADPMIPVPPAGYGGIERIVDTLIRVYRARGHEVGLVAHPDSTAKTDAFFAWPGLDVTSRLHTVRNIAALSRAAGQYRPDVLHSFSRLAYLLALLPRRLPKIMSYQRHTGPSANALARRLAGASLAFTGCSEFICNQGRPAGGTWRAIPNFVDPTAYTFQPQVPPDAPLVFLSRLDREKGADLAIKIARAAGRRLVIAGNIPTQEHQRRYFDTEIAPHFGQNGVEFVGEVDDVQKNFLLGGAAAMIVPIQWDEPFGIVFVEALAAGTPVITCRRGALPEIIEPGRTGWFVTGVQDGADAVARIGELSRPACRAAVEQKYSSDLCAASYLEFYAERMR